MKKQFKFLSTLCIALLMLVGCGTAKEQDTTEVPTNSEGTNAGTDNTTVEEKPNESSESSENDSKSITYTTNNVEKTEETTTATSNEQHYTIQILPSFTLTAEEPGKDMLYLTENDSISMRIENMSVNDLTFEDLQKNTEEMMSFVAENVDYTEFDIQSYVNESIVKYAAYKVDLTDQTVTAVIFEKENQLVRLTIFDNPAKDLTDAMIKMGLTITKTN
ncbi:hypothetical protein [Ureibacillus manganicus]|uniref:hypothetical protein n=1 Tax=Ureibacillus manganicus TaxID=1266064 RepID=UPI00068ED9E8|nr:hypothetical protein [Ureibacillus manganicus]